ncbi:MAG: mglA, partial [Massilia sp.]|nr:mglA [Massilia sp.]
MSLAGTSAAAIASSAAASTTAGAAASTPAGAAAAAAVRMTGVSKSFGGVRALQDVDLSFRRGEIHALLGGNGAGKSTILKILNGVYVPDEGTVEVDGVALTGPTPEAARRAGI